MFKFLFGGKKNTPEVTIESDRDRFARLTRELNEMIDGLSDKPRVTFDPATGHILPETPEQFADEALALPAPDPAPAKDTAAEPLANPTAKTAITEGDAVATKPAPPVSNPPKPTAAQTTGNGRA